LQLFPVIITVNKVIAITVGVTDTFNDVTAITILTDK
jgi:hypothetical protein